MVAGGAGWMDHFGRQFSKQRGTIGSLQRAFGRTFLAHNFGRSHLGIIWTIAAGGIILGGWWGTEEKVCRGMSQAHSSGTEGRRFRLQSGVVGC